MDLMAARRSLLMQNPLKTYEATGNPATFTTNVAKKLKSLIVPFTPVQEGTGDPSPSNVRSISGWTGVTVQHTGKNLFNKNATPFVSGAYYSSQGGSGYPYYQENANYNVYKIPIKPDTTYTFGPIKANDPRWGTLNSIGQAINSEKNNGGTEGTYITFTSEHLAVSLLLSVAVSGTYKCDDTLQLEEGSSHTDYEAFGTSYPVTFPAMGKNLLNVNRTEGTPSPSTLFESPRTMEINKYYPGLRFDNYYYKGYVTYSVMNGVITVQSNNNIHYGVAFPVECKPETYYTINATLTDCGITAGCYDSNWNFIRYIFDVKDGNLPYSFQTPADAKYMTIIFGSKTVGGTGTATNIMLEEGQSGSVYEPFTNTVYGGELDMVTGVLTVTHVKAVVNSTNVGALNYDRNRVLGSVAGFGYGSPKLIQQLVPFNYVKSSTSTTAWNGYLNAYGNLAVYIPEEITSYSDWANYITENPLEFIFELATPITYQLTPQQITSLIGSNTVWSDTNGSNTIQYVKKG